MADLWCMTELSNYYRKGLKQYIKTKFKSSAAYVYVWYSYIESWNLHP